MKDVELMYFLEAAVALRNEHAESGKSYCKDLEISALAKVCADAIRLGEVPNEFYLEDTCCIHTELVEKLLDNLSIPIGTVLRGNKYTVQGKVYYVNICTF